MRLPVSKVYRAFPELDRFEDVRCESFVAAATRAERGTNTLLTVALVPWSVGAFVAIMAAGLLFLGPMLRRLERSNADFGWGAVLLVVMGTVATMAPALSWLMARDVWLRRAIARRIGTCACPACHYSMLGLRAENERVTCPECGKCHELGTLGLTAADILAPPEAALVT